MTSYDIEGRGQARTSQAFGSAFFVDMLEPNNWSVQLLLVDQEVFGVLPFLWTSLFKVDWELLKSQAVSRNEQVYG